jgi:hypothetical protein
MSAESGACTGTDFNRQVCAARQRFSPGAAMEQPTHSLPALFKQLGLASDPVSIDQFIASHSPLKPDLHLADAFFWSASQAEFLRDEILDDADWAEVVDQLDVMLRKGRER